jgi:hypothetical protein
MKRETPAHYIEASVPSHSFQDYHGRCGANDADKNNGGIWVCARAAKGHLHCTLPNALEEDQ